MGEWGSNRYSDPLHCYRVPRLHTVPNLQDINVLADWLRLFPCPEHSVGHFCVIPLAIYLSQGPPLVHYVVACAVDALRSSTLVRTTDTVRFRFSHLPHGRKPMSHPNLHSALPFARSAWLLDESGMAGRSRRNNGPRKDKGYTAPRHPRDNVRGNFLRPSLHS